MLTNFKLSDELLCKFSWNYMSYFKNIEVEKANNKVLKEWYNSLRKILDTYTKNNLK